MTQVDRGNTDNSIGQNDVNPMNPNTDSNGNQSLPICSSDVTPDNSNQPLITGPVGTNVLENGQDTCYTRNMDPLPIYMNIDYAELSNLDQNSPAGDSGIHSYDEHWAVLSTESRNSDSIQISGSTRSTDISPVQKHIVPVRQFDPQFHRGVVNTLQASLIKHGSVSDLNTDGYTLDVGGHGGFFG